MHRLRKAGDPNAFIRAPKPTKEMYDAVQDMHPKTLSACVIVLASSSTSKRNVDIIYRDMMEQVMESGRPRAPLHLKVLAYHHDLAEQGEAPPLELLDLKTVLMPRQWLLKKLDPAGTLSVPALRMILEPHVHEYADVVLRARGPPGLTVKTALNIYKKFHFMSWQPDWGDIPFSCSCKVCFANCVCEDTILFASLFNPKVRVPENWVTATLSSRKVQKPIGGTAGRERRRLIEERACNEKTISSKVKFLKDAPPAEPEEPAEPPSAPAREFVLPPPRSATPSSDNDFEVHTPVAAHGRPD